MTKEAWAREMTSKLNNLRRFSERNTYYQDLFDPVQSHALYGISKKEVPEYKAKLTALGATRFRTVTSNGGGAILCFKADKIKL